MEERRPEGEAGGVPDDAVYHADTPTDQIAYLQRLLDQAHAEVAEYKRGFIEEIRRPLLMELIALAQAVESYLSLHADAATGEEYRDFLQSAVLGDIRQALNRYGVEPFICARGAIDRRLQRVVRVEDAANPEVADQVQPVARGYANAERVFQKEQVILYRARDDRGNEQP